MTFSPSDIETLTGWSPDGQRDLRRKGLLSNYGTATETGRWKYSVRDVVAFWIASRLHHRHDGLDLTTLFAVSWTNAPTVIALIKGDAAQRYLAKLDRKEEIGDNMMMSHAEIVTFADLSELAGRAFDQAHVIDFKHLADTAPDRIKQVIC